VAILLNLVKYCLRNAVI